VLVLAGLFGRRHALTLSPGDFVASFRENIFNLDLWLAAIAAGVVAGLVALRVAAGRIDPNAEPDRWSTSRGWPRAEYERSRMPDTTKPALMWASDPAAAAVPVPSTTSRPAAQQAQPSWCPPPT
jgi:hypothetical protein